MAELTAFLFPGQGQLPTHVLEVALCRSPSTSRPSERVSPCARGSRPEIRRGSRSTDAAQPAVFLDSLARCALLEPPGSRPRSLPATASASTRLSSPPASSARRRARPRPPPRPADGRSVHGGMAAVVKLDHRPWPTRARPLAAAPSSRTTTARRSSSSRRHSTLWRTSSAASPPSAGEPSASASRGRSTRPRCARPSTHSPLRSPPPRSPPRATASSPR